jgi:hypothetical protein
VVELLEPRQLLSLAFTAGRSTDSHGRTAHASATLSIELTSTNGAAFAPPNPLHANAIAATKAAPASRGTSKASVSNALVNLSDTLESVTFGGKGFHPIKSDVQLGFPTYSTDQWLGGENPHRQPVLYAASSTLTVSASWRDRVSSPGAGGIFARATTSNGLTIAATPVKEEAGKLLLPPVHIPGGGSNPRAAAATAPFGKDAQFCPHFVIHWQLSFDGGKNWLDAGQSDDPLYVSASTNPLPDFFSRKFYLTAVDSEINESLGLTAANEPAIVSNTWKLFAGRAVRQFSPTAPLSDGTEHRRPLTYYGTPASATDPTGQQFRFFDYTFNATVPQLLADGDGQCAAWARLFLDMLLVDGIYQENDTVTVIPQESKGFLVNNWNFIGNGTSGNPNYPYLDEPGKLYEVTKQPGVPGQNSPDPLSFFGNHVVAHINGTYYDPSYGETFANLRQMTANVVAGFYRLVPGRPEGSEAFEIQKASARGELLKLYDVFTWKPPSAS